MISVELKNNSIWVKIDQSNGATASIVYANDSDGMNWIFDKLPWGRVPGFDFVSASQVGDAVTATYQNARNQLTLTVEKSITETDYNEKYVVENNGSVEFFLTKDNFGILMPTNCNFSKCNTLMDKCISHIWCGGDVCWMYSKRTNGQKPYLVMNLTKGAVDDYSIDYDYSLTRSGADWRGAFLLHPRECVIKPQAKLELNFRFRFTDVAPEFAPLDFDGAMRFTASKYSLNVGEKATLTLEYNGALADAKIICEGKSLPLNITDGKVEIDGRINGIYYYESKPTGKRGLFR